MEPGGDSTAWPEGAAWPVCHARAACPNPIGLSAVRLVRIEGLVLHIEGLDMLDGTPVLDIKPYLPFADAVSNATSGWLEEAGLA